MRAGRAEAVRLQWRGVFGKPGVADIALAFAGIGAGVAAGAPAGEAAWPLAAGCVAAGTGAGG